MPTEMERIESELARLNDKLDALISGEGGRPGMKERIGVVEQDVASIKDGIRLRDKFGIAGLMTVLTGALLYLKDLMLGRQP